MPAACELPAGPVGDEPLQDTGTCWGFRHSEHSGEGPHNALHEAVKLCLVTWGTQGTCTAEWANPEIQRSIYRVFSGREEALKMASKQSLETSNTSESREAKECRAAVPCSSGSTGFTASTQHSISKQHA